jgi:hypothetical protein
MTTVVLLGTQFSGPREGRKLGVEVVNLRVWSAFSYPITAIEWFGLKVNLLKFLTKPQSWVPNSKYTYIVVYFLKLPKPYEFEFCSTVWQLNCFNEVKDLKYVFPHFF